jgi:hypothetical protein
MRPNGTLEDIAAVIGFSATIRLSSWYGGKTLHVPVEPRDSHPLFMVLGASPFKALVEEWGGESISIPINAEYHDSVRRRSVAVMIASGMSSRDISSVLYISPQHVNRLKIEAEELGMLPKSVTKTAQGAPVKSTVRG